MSVSRSLPKLLLVLYIGALAVLAYSVLRSGLLYQYDSDELSQSGITYLIAHGFVPYVSFWWPYSPLFNFFLLPLFTFFGFTFDTIYLARILMVVLFFLRIGITMAILRAIGSKLWAVVFCALILLDPFTTFSGMQIRQDNLMLTVYLFGFLIFTHAFLKQSRLLFFLSGFVIALSSLILIKIIPSAASVSVIFFLWSIYTKSLRMFLAFVLGAVCAVSIFSFYFIATGTFFHMVQQMILDPYTFQSAVRYPTPATFFYRPDNVFIYGVGGKPLSWWYIWMLPVLGFLGVYLVLEKKIKNVLDSRKNILLSIMATSLVVHWLLLLTIQSAYMQYHLPSQWYFAFFGSLAISAIIERTQKNSYLRIVGYACALIAFGIFAQASFIGNIARSRMDIHWTVDAFKRRWQQIPENAYVFPDFLFRPIPYPLTNQDFAGNNFGPVLLARYGPMRTALEKKNVKYLMLTEYTLGFVPWEDRQYIEAHYTRKDEELWTRKDL